MTKKGANLEVLTNVVANMVGKIVTAASGVILTPLQLSVLGNEAFGAITVCNTFNTILTLLDLGIGRAVQVDVAKSARSGAERIQSPLFSVGEISYWILSVVGCSLLWFLSPYLANEWLRSTTLTTEELADIIRLSSFQFIFSFPSGLYVGVLSALEKQVAVNVALVVGAFVRVAVAYYTLTRPAVSVAYVLLANVLAALLVCLALFSLARRHFEYQGLFRHLNVEILTKLKFAGGVAVIAAINVAVSQADKLIASGILSLEQMASLGVASSFALIPNFVGVSINSAVTPRIVYSSVSQSKAKTARLYKVATLLSVTAVFSVSAVVTSFAPQLLDLWTGRQSLSEKVVLLISLIVAGTAAATMSYVIVSLQYAYGNTAIGTIVNLVTLVVCPTLTYCGVKAFGLIGVALGPAASAAIQFVLNHKLTFATIFPGESQIDYYSTLVKIILVISFVTCVVALYLKRYPVPAFYLPLAILLSIILNAVSVWPILRRAGCLDRSCGLV